MCRAHNQLYAEDVFGREHIEHRRREQTLDLTLRALGQTFPPESELPTMPDLLRGVLRALAP